MPSAARKRELPLVWEVPSGPPLTSAAWRAWAIQPGLVVLLAGVKWAAIGSLLAAGAFWTEVWQFEVVVRSLVGIAAAVAALQALSAKHYQVASSFCAIGLLFNPVLPLLSLTGDWQRALTVASGVPFVLSLAWRGREEATR